MGYVEKIIGTATIRTDSFNICTKERAEELKALGIVEKRKAIGIVIYPEANDEFNYFYERHVRHSIQIQGSDAVSVLVVDNNKPPTKEEAKLLLEEALRRATLGPKVIKLPVQQAIKGKTASIREWSFAQNEFISEPKNCCFILRDNQEVTARKKFYEIANSISEKDFTSIVQKLDGACKPKAEYIVQYIWFIGKYFVAA